jgi:hypothetical protein
MARRFVVVVDVPDAHPVRTLEQAQAFVEARINSGIKQILRASITVYPHIRDACDDWIGDWGAFSTNANPIE